MSIFQQMFTRSDKRTAVSYQTVFQQGDSLEFSTLSGTNITEKTVFQVNAVYSAVSLISDTIATLPVDVYIRRDGARYPFRPAPAWVQKPDVDLPREAFYSAVITSMLLNGNAFIRIFSNERGEVVNLIVLNPMNVDVKRNGLGQLIFTIKNGRQSETITSEEMIFIPDLVRPGDVRGVSRVEALKENFGLALALEKFAANFFGNGTNLAGVIEFPGNLSQEQAKQLSEGFDNRHRGWKRNSKTGVLSGGAKWVSTQADPERSSLIESRNESVRDIARAFNVPPHLLALEGSNSYASVEQNNLAWVTHGLRPIIQKIEGGLSPLMARTPGGENAFIKFNLDGLLRADIQSRMSAYSTGLQSGFLTINDVRRLEDLRPVDDASADTVRVPLANVNVDAANLQAESIRIADAQKLILAGFKPSAVMEALGLPDIEHTGLPSTQLQMVSMIDEADPESVYEV
jgi:HK97 family phage portal protein